jgi:hypothetical protein
MNKGEKKMKTVNLILKDPYITVNFIIQTKLTEEEIQEKLQNLTDILKKEKGKSWTISDLIKEAEKRSYLKTNKNIGTYSIKIS